MKILFLTPYPHGQAPSQRFRFEQYLDLLREEGHELRIQAFLDVQTWTILYQKGHYLSKAWGIAKGFLRRFAILLKLHPYDAVFIHREASPIGPPFFEWLIARGWKKRLIYDFDDAIWLPNTSEQNRLAASLKFHQKVAYICNWSHTVSCGNEYLANYARQHTKGRVIVNPTTIDTLEHHNRTKDQQKEPLIIGWTGTHSTLHYLRPVLPALASLATKYPELRFHIISNQPPDFSLPGLEFRPWKKENEIEELLTFHIGLMPLTEDRWTAGKCGFKALQYMALGIPPVVSPVGVNKEIVQHGHNGFIAHTLQEWEQTLEQLINDVKLREALGKNAVQAVASRFSVEANRETFLGLFNEGAYQRTTRAAI
jgi:glycosyltransferase involved in cell wall biosynthesis